MHCSNDLTLKISLKGTDLIFYMSLKYMFRDRLNYTIGCNCSFVLESASRYGYAIYVLEKVLFSNCWNKSYTVYLSSVCFS
jgi:hypothetical protein